MNSPTHTQPWKPPKGSNGKRPSEEIIAGSMGVRKETLALLIRITKEQIVGQDQILNNPHWKEIEAEYKSTLYTAMEQHIVDNYAGRRDFEDVLKCLHHGDFMEYVGKFAWGSVRTARNKRQKREQQRE